jgi:hypothetical protein
MVALLNTLTEEIMLMLLTSKLKDMKKIIGILLIAAFIMPASAQKLLDIYKKGTVKLVPDNTYAQNNNWDKVFRNYLDTISGKPMGDRKSLKIMPDGSVVVNHAYRNYYTKFTPNGTFEKEFGIKNSKGEQFKKINSIEGILDNNTFYTGLDNMGNMVCFDFNGNFKKTLKINYMTRQAIPLPNGKIALVGWVIWETKFRDFVSIVDYATNQEKVIWEHFTPKSDPIVERRLFNYAYKFKKGGMVSCNTMPFSKDIGMTSPPVIACIENNIIVAIPTTGEIQVYDLEGKLVVTDKIEWARNFISIEEQKEIQQKAINEYRSAKDLFGVANEESKAAQAYMVKEMETDLGRISEPIPLPAFATLIKDSDGNLLFFEYPKEENTNKFNVWIYERDGKFICQSSFVCDEYNLTINSSKMVFHNGYIYGLQLLKKANGVPLRLVRFKVTGE